MNKRKSYSRYFFKGYLETIRKAIFFDWITLVVCLGIVLTVCFSFSPGTLTMRFPKLDSQVSIIESLSRIVGVFLGIILSLLVLSFNIFNRYFGRFVFNVLLKSRPIKFLFTLFIFTLGFLLYSLSYLKEIEKPENYSNALFVLSIFFSVSIVFSIFPATGVLLKTSQNRTNVMDAIKNLNGSFGNSDFTYMNSGEIKITASPIITLIEIGTISIKDYDITTTEMLITGIENNYKHMFSIHNEHILRGMYMQTNQILTSLFSIAAKERNENALNSIVNARFKLEI